MKSHLLLHWRRPKVRDEGARSALESEEGQFTISESCLVELAMHRKVKRLPNGRRGRVEKAIVRHPDLAGMMDCGDTVVDKLCGVDTEAFGYRPCIYRCLLRHIFERYQLNGRLPEKEGSLCERPSVPVQQIVAHPNGSMA